jgi:hypothetical protein
VFDGRETSEIDGEREGTMSLTPNPDNPGFLRLLDSGYVRIDPQGWNLIRGFQRHESLILYAFFVAGVLLSRHRLGWMDGLASFIGAVPVHFESAILVGIFGAAIWPFSTRVTTIRPQESRIVSTVHLLGYGPKLRFHYPLEEYESVTVTYMRKRRGWIHGVFSRQPAVLRLRGLPGKTRDVKMIYGNGPGLEQVARYIACQTKGMPIRVERMPGWLI